MAATPPAVVVALLARLLREAFDGPPGPWSYFTDMAPATGFFGTIDVLSAVEVSREGGPARSTIAGHVHHVAASLGLAARGLRGESASRDRSGSWTIRAVDDADWAALRERLRAAYQDLMVACEMHAVWDEDALGTAVGAIAHVAYHLGAIRQRLPRRATKSRPNV
ncbi:MAG TPA: hypothetical protein VM736_00085 [Gemmatimonadales bacterium]|nr:hypothetical protein [Gemmatimonadales bacterium]